MELPLTVNGNRYVITFIDYLTKWVESFACSEDERDHCEAFGGQCSMSTWCT